jgi:hypothetical protein
MRKTNKDVPENQILKQILKRKMRMRLHFSYLPQKRDIGKLKKCGRPG